MAVELKGALELRKALRNFGSDLGKETSKEIAAILKPITKEARGYAPAESPLSGWARRPDSHGKFPTYDATEVKRGIGYKTTPSKANSKGFVALASIRNKSAAGAIYETAGRKTTGGKFVPKLIPLTESPAGKGRAIYRAWKENNGKAVPAVIRAINSAAAKLNARATV